MDAQSKNDTVGTVDSGLTPSTIPGGCDNAQNGVSVENMPVETAGYEWYVFRASYGREEKASDLMGHLNAQAYIARHTVYVRTEDGVRPVVKKLLPNFVFAYLTRAESELFVKGPVLQKMRFEAMSQEEQKHILGLNIIISYYYNHFANENGKNPPLTIPYEDMRQFIIATGTEKNVMPVDESQFEIGEEVEVVMGEFQGFRGKVMRKLPNKKRLLVQLHGSASPQPERKGKQRLFFQLPCLGSFCSALIPTAYFRKIEDAPPNS